MTDPLHLIDEATYFAFRLGLDAAVAPANCLVIRDGVYSVSPASREYHPLEVVLAGEPVLHGDWRADLAVRLGVTTEWLDGFVDGFAQSAEASTRQDYLQGYLAAEELLERRFRCRGGEK